MKRRKNPDAITARSYVLNAIADAKLVADDLDDVFAGELLVGNVNTAYLDSAIAYLESAKDWIENS